MVAQVRYSVVGRSRGRVAPCTICTGHVETRNTGFLVEPQNQGRRGGPEATLGWAAGARAAGHVAAPELPRAGQRELEPQDTWRPRSYPGLGSGSCSLRTHGGPGAAPEGTVRFLPVWPQNWWRRFLPVCPQNRWSGFLVEPQNQGD
jgi:hypothetical protein